MQDPLRRSEARRQKAPKLLVDQAFANSSNEIRPSLNSTFLNVVPKSLRPKPTARAQSSYRIKDGKLLLGGQQKQLLIK